MLSAKAHISSVRSDLTFALPAALTLSHGGMSALLPAKNNICKSQVRPAVLSRLLSPKTCATRDQVGNLISNHLDMLVVLPAYARIVKSQVKPTTTLPCCIDLHP